MEEQVEYTPQPKKKFRKLKRIFLILASLFLIVLVTGIVLANVYEKEIKRFAIDEINTHLKAKLKINEDDVTFSFFKKFPNASLNFADLLIQDENQKDTLLFTENFSLEFGLSALFSGNYKVKELELDQAIINLYVDEKGKENYIFWKESKEIDTTESALNFSLKGVNFNDITVNYHNKKTKNNAILRINEANFEGDFQADSSVVSIHSDLYIATISSDSTVYFADKESKLSIDKAVFRSEEITMEKGVLTLGDMSLAVDGLFDLKKKQNTVTAVAKNVEISEVFSLMPNEVSESLKAYRTDGFVNGNIEIKTNSREDVPRITSSFEIINGTITEASSGVEMENIALTGTYDLSPFSQKIDITKAKGSISGGEFELTGKMMGNEIQTIMTTLRGDFQLEKLSQFLNIESVEKMGGELSINNEFRGTIRNGNWSVTEFLGSAKLTDASLVMKETEESYQKFNGDFNFNRFKSSANLTGNYGKSDLSISTQFSNFIPYLVNNQTMEANIYLQSQLLELDKLLGNEKQEVTSGEDTIGVVFPDNITATISATVGKLMYNKHELDQLNGRIILSSTGLVAPNLSFVSNKGKYELDGKLTVIDTGFVMESNISCAQIDISDLLLKFNNFEQEVVRSEHLSGRANAVITIASSMNKHLELDLSSIVVNAEYSISDGELKNLELFEEIGAYLKSNAISRSIIKVDELSQKLKLVKFSEFSNTLLIKNRMITIPSMFIKTSAMDIGLYGTQSFDFDINYGMNLRLKDILTKKKDTEYGYIQDDGSGARVFLLMTGTIDEPIFKLDKEGRKNYKEEQREAEKNNVKGILKDEFGLFKNDEDATKKAAPEKAKPKFEVEWGEEPKTEKKEEKEVEKEKKKKKSWLDKLKGEEEEKKKVGFEVD